MQSENNPQKIFVLFFLAILLRSKLYHTLADAQLERLLAVRDPRNYKVVIAMTKLSVLLIFAGAKTLLTPDYVCRKLQPRPDLRSLYSYLARLHGQGLLERGPDRRRGYLSYKITEKGHKRIAYFRAQIAPAAGLG